MAFWIVALLWIGNMVLGKIVHPRQKAVARSPQAPGEFSFPTAEVGRPVPVAFGTVIVRGTNIAWVGDKSVIGTGPYLYLAGVQAILCKGSLSVLKEVRFNDVPLAEAALVIDSSNDAIIYKIGAGADTTVNLDHGTYSSMLALAFNMASKLPADTVCTFGRAIGDDGANGNRINRVIKYAVTISGVSTNSFAVLRPGWYGLGATGGGVPALSDTLLTEVARALNETESQFGGGARCVFAASLVGGKIRLTVSSTKAGYTGFIIRATTAAAGDNPPGISANVALGFDILNDQVVTGGVTTLDAVNAVPTERAFCIGYRGTNLTIRSSLSGCNARTILGLGTVDHATLGVFSGTTIISGRFMRFGGQSSYSSSGASGPEVQDRIMLAVFSGLTAEIWGEEGHPEGVIDVHRGLGPISLYAGGTAESAENAYLASKSVTGSALRGITQAVMRFFLHGYTNYPKPFSLVLNSSHAVTGMDDVNGYNQDDNPAAALYFILTDAEDWLGIPTSAIDLTSFQTAAATLVSEGIGYSRLIEQEQDGADIAEELLQLMDGILYEDPSTALLSLALVRGGYSMGSIPAFDEDNCTVTRFSRRAIEDTRNVVRVKYTDQSNNYKTGTVQVQDLASIQSRGGVLSAEEFDFPGISNATTAQVVATRTLKALSPQSAELELTMDRSAWALRRGSVFKLDYPDFGISAMPCRVTNISPGTLEDGTIQVSAIEDPYRT